MSVKGSCHCGATQFEVETAPTELTDCNCSFCAKRGNLVAYYQPSSFKLLTARDRVSTYQWGAYMGAHHHCAICGCGTYGEFSDFSSGEADYDNPRISINVRLLENFDLSALPVVHLNGRDDW
ncbi:GFA family protein [Caulobacter endophyticus]|uniref:GFA family protein n=1 Tax=Caulobacter endophyticus TaxID=2172652 RepID=UPI00240FC3F3|nr:GFA family protein [Caulobacter endophyticus]MDG2529587.1 GFA family protein [Caulobacter endophyticus]